MIGTHWQLAVISFFDFNYGFYHFIHINIALKHGYLDLDQVLSDLQARPPMQHERAGITLRQRRQRRAQGQPGRADQAQRQRDIAAAEAAWAVSRAMLQDPSIGRCG